MFLRRTAPAMLLAVLGVAIASCETEPTPPPDQAQQSNLAPVPLPQAHQRYVVFFDKWSTAMNDTGRAIVARAAKDALDHASLPVTVTGYADPEGTQAQNVKLSAARAKAVADELTADGVPQARITKRSVGSIGYIADPQEARRVVIAIGEEDKK